MDVRRITRRISSVNLVLDWKMVTIVSVYAPQDDRSEDKDSFYNDLRAEMQLKNGNYISLGILVGMLEAL